VKTGKCQDKKQKRSKLVVWVTGNCFKLLANFSRDSMVWLPSNQGGVVGRAATKIIAASVLWIL